MTLHKLNQGIYRAMYNTFFTIQIIYRVLFVVYIYGHRLTLIIAKIYIY